MHNVIFWQWLTLSLFVLFMGFCFCDGFSLHILKKLLWFTAIIVLAIFSLKINNEFDLTVILPIPILLAILFCYSAKRRQKNK
jgi:hypothetical protein